ncbi:MAG: hypothetical protein LBV12_07695 [Puniceicoccales bacterium]|jgi:hypothetical protein|nr:hypothetical protein [Puniceicoccales bacterium]
MSDDFSFAAVHDGTIPGADLKSLLHDDAIPFDFLFASAHDTTIPLAGTKC